MAEKSTLEEAMECPKCHNPGKLVSEGPSKSPEAARGTKMRIMECVTVLCPWHEERWLIQLNPDGSIPEAYSGIRGAKAYPELSPEMESRVNENIRRQLEAETHGGGEVK
jgi:hypothetical protein